MSRTKDEAEYEYAPRKEALELVIQINQTIADSGLDQEGIGPEAVALLYGAQMVGQPQNVQNALKAVAQYGADSFVEYLSRNKE